MIKNISSKNVTLNPSLFKNRAEHNRDYLMSLNNKALLQNFYLEAGINLPNLMVVEDPENSWLHWGWEAPSSQLRGHFLGHWLSAAAMLYQTNHDIEIKAKMEVIINELARCQEENGGKWVGSIPEKYFTRLEKKKDIWSPQYTMHKTLMGLLDAYRFAGNEKALEIISAQADWYVDWTHQMLKVNPAAIYSGEEGGMLEIWVTLYELTQDEKYMELAHQYDHPELFDNLLNNEDSLSCMHANSSIPWAHGAAKMYEVTQDEKYLEITKKFWKNAITDRGTFCTGGQNAGEFWTHPNMIGQFISKNTQEFCTVYNLIRLASYLFSFTGEKLYADYIEKNLYNGVLAQSHKQTSLPTYFLPMKAGSHKKFASPTRDFWCCSGTMVQAHTLYASLIYQETDDCLIVSQYIPSSLHWSHNDIDVHFTTGLNMKQYNSTVLFDGMDHGAQSRWALKFKVNCKKENTFTIALRVPEWINGMPELSINGKQLSIDAISNGEYDVKLENGFLKLSTAWKQDEIEIFFPSCVKAVGLPDVPDEFALVDGPIVLAGLSDAQIKILGDAKNPSTFLLAENTHTYEDFPWQQNHYRTMHQSRNIDFVPLYEITDEAYTVYFEIK